MGHSRADKQATHGRIVAIAAQRFREVGIEGISVADIMTEAGLTVGGFYKHFASRDELVAQAMALALDDLEGWTDIAQRDLREAIRAYLCDAHRDLPASGCALAALANDVSRSGAAVREVYTSGLKRVVDIVERALPATKTGNRRTQALTLLSACVGALTLSRAVTDEALSRQILDNVADELIAAFALTRSRAAS
ncbi:TetR/AcrR family transcriptional regulator [Paraburkholderia acidisoli]|uniref:TetR family transcriptional regulator n=1 Tax=Paraburkholderia acidisoli TaxID=2571748 RepID=A0A7Z2GQF9_9BURK|nr:TetR/AcrR family transcriptional regulator [Paraburkholderia acidisoli]QGZ65689.1 TetR family transcriptional regulator [Paraburkholderia acidisoli]